MTDAVPSDTPPQPPAKPLDSSYLFNGDAQGILEGAPNLDIGIGLLSDAYNAKTWDAPDKAKETFAKYAQELRYRFKDTPAYSEQDTLTHAPIPLTKFQGLGDTPEEKKISQINQWEEANKKYLDTTTSSDWLIDRDKLKRSVDASASELRRGVNGADENWLMDKAYRAADGFAGNILKAVGLNDSAKYFSEHTRPDTPDIGFLEKTARGLASGTGFLGGAGLSALIPGVGPYVSATYMLGSGAASAANAYSESKENTGDKSYAWRALELEGLSQGAQLFAAQRMLKGSVTAARNLFSEAAPVTQALAGTAIRSGEAAVVGGVGGALTDAAKQYESYSPNTNVWQDIQHAATLNAIFGGGLGAVHEAINVSADQATKNISPFNGYFPPDSFGWDTDTKERGPIVFSDGAPLNTEATRVAPEESDPTTVTRPKTKHDFMTSDGTGYTLTPDGKSASMTSAAGDTTHPLDRTYYVDRDTAVKLSALKNVQNTDGSVPKFTISGGQLYVRDIANHPLALNDEIALKGKRQSDYAPPTSDTPGIGLYPVQVNGARTVNGVSPEYRVHLGQDITDLNPESFVTEEVPAEALQTEAVKAEQVAQEIQGQAKETPPVKPVVTAEGVSVGAAYAGKTKTTVTRQRFLESPDVNTRAKEELLNNSTQYFTLPNAETADEADKYIAQNGIQGSTQRVLNRSENEVSPQLTTLAQRLIKHYNSASLKAEAAGDFDSAGKLASTMVDLVHHFEEMNSTSGRVLQMQRSLLSDPDMYLLGMRQKLKDKAVSEVALEEGLKPEEVTNKSRELQDAVNQKEAVLEEGRAQQATAVAEEQAKAPKPKDGEKSKPTPSEAKAPEDFLTPEQQARLDDLNGKIDKAQKIVDKTTNRVGQKLEENKERLDNLSQIMNALGQIQEPNARTRLMERAFEEEGDLMKKVQSRPDGTFWNKVWQGDKISGVGTIEKKGIFDLLNGSLFTPASLMLSRYPGAGLEFLKGFVGSALDGSARDQYLHTLFTGEEPTGVWGLDPEKPFKLNEQTAEKFFNGQDLLKGNYDRNTFMGKVKGFYSNIGWVFRNLGAINAAYEGAFKEAGARAEAYRVAKKEGLSGDALRERLGQQLFNSTDNWNAALDRATKDAETLKQFGIETTPREIRLRASNIIDAQRAPELQAEADKFLNSVSLTKPVEGFLGQVIEGLGGITRAKLPIAGTTIQPLKYVLPFLRVSGNLVNLGMDYVPGTRVITGAAFDKSLGDLERTGLIGRQLSGTVLLASAFGTAMAFKDEKDPPFWITGAGPTDPKDKEVFRNSGMTPWSIRIAGNSFSYAHTPLTFIFGGLGSLLDKMKYDKTYDPKNLGSDIKTVTFGAFNSFAHQSFLGSLGKIVDAAYSKDHAGSQVADAIGASLINIGKGFIPGEGALRSIARAIDDTPSTYHDTTAKLLEGIPLAERATNKWLNVFGEPLYKSDYQHIGSFYSRTTTDPDFRWMAENGYGTTIPLHVEVPHVESSGRDPGATHGAKMYDVLTQDERTKLVETAGPRIRALIAAKRQEYGNSAYNPQVQRDITRETNRIVKETKQDLFIH